MISNFSKKFLPFEDARLFVRKLGLSGENEFRQYCKSGKKPENIPYHPVAEKELGSKNHTSKF